MNAPLKHTGAEEVLLDMLAKAGSRGNSAFERIKSNGLPTRRVEAWHYTDLRSLITEFPKPAAASSENDAKSALGCVAKNFSSVLLPIVDGEFYSCLATTLPQKVLIASKSLPDTLSAPASDDTIGLLNGALASDGLNIIISENALLEDMLCIAHISSLPGSVASHHTVRICDGASATIMELHQCTGTGAAFTNTVCDIELGEGAIATWVIDQQMNDASTRFGQLNVKLGKNADLTILSLNSGSRLLRQEINVEVAGEGAELKIRGVNLIGDGAHIDVTTKLDHLVPDTISNELFRNVVVGAGRGVFQGSINVAQIAQHTDARMACNSLLLGEVSEFLAKPELEIFADDVQCAHGATVTDIDEEQLFYLMARGIPQKECRKILIQAFVEEVFGELEVEQIGEHLNARIAHWLAANG